MEIANDSGFDVLEGSNWDAFDHASDGAVGDGDYEGLAVDARVKTILECITPQEAGVLVEAMRTTDVPLTGGSWGNLQMLVRQLLERKHKNSDAAKPILEILKSIPEDILVAAFVRRFVEGIIEPGLRVQMEAAEPAQLPENVNEVLPKAA